MFDDDDDGCDCCESRVCGVILSTLTWAIIGFCSGSVFLFLEVEPLALGVYSLLVLLAFSSHIAAMISNPGFVPQGGGEAKWLQESESVYRDTKKMMKKKSEVSEEKLTEKEIEFCCKRAVQQLKRSARYCSVCREYKPSNAHHCSVCNRCVRRMDHHCPWVNNCVGESNIRYFMQFLFYIMVSSLYSTVLFIYRAFVTIQTPANMRFQKGSNPVTFLICCIVSVILCIIFLIFSCAMWSEQYSAVVTDTPGIDALQNNGRTKKYGFFMGLRKTVCYNKRMISYVWWCPIPYYPTREEREKEE